MKYKILYLLAIVSCLLSCSEEAGKPDDRSSSREDGLLSIDFEEASLTRAVGKSPLALGTLFKVYAYNQGTVVENATIPVGEGTYVIGETNDGSGTKKQTITSKSGSELKLYAGTYDLYFVSYNSASEVPVVANTSIAPSLITGLANGKDFLYTYMKDVGVRSVNAGDTNFLITLNKTFERMCSGLLFKVKAKDGTHPVMPRSLRLMSIVISHLSAPCDFLLGNNTLPVFQPANQYTGSLTYGSDSNPDAGFRNNDGTESASGVVTTAIPEAGIYQVLPTNGAATLAIDITLEVGYYAEGASGITKTNYPYHVVVNKALQAGNCYELTFSLTFYDSYVPDNLELDIIPYIPLQQDTGHVGG